MDILDSRALIATDYKLFAKGSLRLAYNTVTCQLFSIDSTQYRILSYAYPLRYDRFLASVKRDFSLNYAGALRLTQSMLFWRLLHTIDDHSSPDPLRAPMRKRFQPDTMYLSIIQDCNLRCDYCSAGYGRFGGKPTRMEHSIIKRALDVLVSTEGHRATKNVMFVGGEPLLNPDRLFWTLAYGRELSGKTGIKIHFAFNTNGTLLTPDLIAKLCGYPVSITFSIDGYRDIHDMHRVYPSGEGTYDIAVANYKAYCEVMRARDPSFRSRIQCCLPLGRNLYKAYKSLKELGASVLIMNPSWKSQYVRHALELPFNCIDDYVEQYQQVLNDFREQVTTGGTCQCAIGNMLDIIHHLWECHGKPLGCGAANDGFAIAANGDVYPCPLFIGNPQYRMGNIVSGVSLDRIELIQREVAVLAGKCIPCWARSLCGAACLGMAVAQSCQDYTEPSPYCGLFRKIVESSIIQFAEISSILGSVRRPNVSSDVTPAPKRVS